MTFRTLLFALAAALGAAAAPSDAAAQAEAPAAGEERVAELVQVMQVPAIIEVLRDEGMDYALSLDADLFGGTGGAGWRQTVEAVHDLPRMQGRFEAALNAAVAGDAETVAAALVFFGSDRGQRLLSLEIEARRALLDEAVEDAAKARFGRMVADRDVRLDLLQRFVEANDLVEMNVQGALNANLAFYRGLAEAGGPGSEDVTEENMLADVWSQEADVRAETEAWLYPYLAMAYGGLPDEDLEAYIDFSESRAGKRLNAALFAAFDALFNAQSYDLGLATGRQLAGQDI
jgi:hypothetical protein